MGDADIQRTIGRLEQAVSTLTADMKQLREGQAEIAKTLQEAKGGWRTLMWIAGAAGGVGAAISAFLKGHLA